MKASELITALKEHIEKYGDQDICTWSPTENCDVRPVSYIARMEHRGKDIAVVDCHRNWPSTTGKPSGDYRDNNYATK